MFGMMNEDLHGERKNMMIWDHGMIVATEELIGPVELVTEYGDEYDLDEVKWMGLRRLESKSKRGKLMLRNGSRRGT